MATRSSILAKKIPWTEEPGGLQSMGLQRVGHNWATKHTHTIPYLHLPLNPIISKSFLSRNSTELTSHIPLKTILFNRTSNPLSSILLTWFSATVLTAGHFFLLKFSVLWFMTLCSWFSLICVGAFINLSFITIPSLTSPKPWCSLGLYPKLSCSPHFTLSMPTNPHDIYNYLSETDVRICISNNVLLPSNEPSGIFQPSQTQHHNPHPYSQ